MTYSSLSVGSLPSTLAMTFCESIVRMVFFTPSDAFRPSGTGWNSLVSAFFFRSSKFWPAISKIFLATSRVTQPSIAERSMFLFFVTTSNFSLRLPWTTSNG